MSTLIVKRATQAFNQGNYQKAKRLYLQAAEKYGEKLFTANLTLCERALNNIPIQQRNVSADVVPALQISRQLAETQKLLEHYYNRCQELEYQLIAKN